MTTENQLSTTLSITSTEEQTLKLINHKVEPNDNDFRKLLIYASSLYGLNIPTEIQTSIIKDFILTNEQGLNIKQIEDALKLNLSGKFGQIIKVFNAELTCVFLSQVFLEYEKYIETLKVKETHKLQIDFMKAENDRIENQRKIDKENFTNDVKTQWLNGTLNPEFYHYQTLIDLGFIQENKEVLQTLIDKIKFETENSPANNFLDVLLPNDAQIKDLAKKQYIELKFKEKCS
jgi:hypothetical protein